MKQYHVEAVAGNHRLRHMINFITETNDRDEQARIARNIFAERGETVNVADIEIHSREVHQ